MQINNLQIAPQGVMPVVHASQYDYGREIKFMLFDGATAYIPPVGASVFVEGVKSDGNGFAYDCTWSGNQVTFELTQQMTVFAETVPCELRIINFGNINIGTLNFKLEVEKSPIDGDTPISDTEIPAIIELAESEMLNAEAWANGTRGGDPVAPNDPAYHNNAKYWSDQASSIALSELTDTDISNPTTGQVLSYENSKWENKSLGTAASKDSTDTISSGSTDLIESGAVYAKTEPLWDNMIDCGVINRFQNTATTQTKNGVSFTVNADKSITANGTATDEITWAIGEIKNLQNGAYKLTGCPQGGSASTFFISLFQSQVIDINEVGDGIEFNKTSAMTTAQIYIRVKSGQILNNVIFKPMITDPIFNLSYDDYLPPSMSNVELTNEINDIHYGNITSSYKIMDATLNFYMTSDALPDYSNITTQDATDFAQGLYDMYKKLGGERDTIFNGFVHVKWLKKSDGTQLGSSKCIYTFMCANGNYDVILSDNSKTRIIFQMSEYGYPVHTEFGIWGSTLTTFKYGIDVTNTTFDIKKRNSNLGNINSFIG